MKKAILMFLLTFFLSFLFIKQPLSSLKEPLSILVKNHSSKDWSSNEQKKLLKGDKISAEFKANYQNLGIVAVKFETGRRSVKDEVVFRLREKGAKKWIYENKYKTDQFQHDAFFPFGFPVIADSNGKVYNFEIESLSGTEKESVILSADSTNFQSKYSLNKAQLLPFLTKKVLSSFDGWKLFVQLLASTIVTFAAYFLVMNKRKFKWKLNIPALSSRNQTFLIIGLAFLFTLFLFRDNLFASLGLIDDHWIMFFLGPDRKVNILEIPQLILQTEVGKFGQYERFRPTYYTLQVIESFLWRDNAFLWYFFRISILTASISIFIFLIKKYWGLLFGLLLTAYIFTFQYWADIWARLGPGEIYAVFGTALFALGFISYKEELIKGKKLKSLSRNALFILIGFIIAAGSKENFLILLLPLIYLFVHSIIKKASRLNILILGLPFLFGFYVFSAIALALSKSGKDVYLTDTQAQGRLSLLVSGTILFIKKFKLHLYLVLAAAVPFISMGIKGTKIIKKELLPAIKNSILGIVGLFILFISQYVFYNGAWPTDIRYDFPGLLTMPFIILIYLYLVIKNLSIYGQKSLSEIYKWLPAAVFLGLILIRGFDPIQAQAKLNRERTNEFKNNYAKITNEIKQNPTYDIVFESYSLWDYEPIFSLERYFYASNIKNSTYLRIHGYEAKNLGPLETELASKLIGFSKNGSNKDFIFKPLGNLREKKECISIVFFIRKNLGETCSLVTYL